MTRPPSEAGSAGTSSGLACGGTERRVGGRGNIEGEAANRGENGQTAGRGQHAWSLARGRARSWSRGGVGGAGSPRRWQPPRAEDAPGIRAASLPERGSWRVLEHGARQPAPLPLFIRLLLLLQRSGSRCPSPPGASAGLSADLSSKVVLGKLVRMP